jgi:kynurenine formamidase
VIGGDAHAAHVMMTATDEPQPVHAAVIRRGLPMGTVRQRLPYRFIEACRAAVVLGIAAGALVSGGGAAAHLSPGRPAGRAGAQAPQPQANLSAVTRDQFDRWMTQLSNWGRWGKDDERGALNLITSEKQRQAAALVRAGTTVSLARPLTPEKISAAASPRPINRMGALANLFLIDGDYLYERQEIEYHGGRVSHFDALCHVSHNGKVYNGLNFKEIVTQGGGCTRLGVTSAKDGIVTRGILLDLPGTRVRPEDIAAWEKRTGLSIGRGDALLLRTRVPGGADPLASFGSAGYDPSLIPFFKERDIALLGSDSAQEGGAIPGVFIPIHTFTLVALGMNLLDNLALDDLAATANTLRRWEFMLVVEPLRVENGAGSPVNPVAIF